MTFSRIVLISNKKSNSFTTREKEKEKEKEREKEKEKERERDRIKEREREREKDGFSEGVIVFKNLQSSQLNSSNGSQNNETATSPLRTGQNTPPHTESHTLFPFPPSIINSSIF